MFFFQGGVDTKVYQVYDKLKLTPIGKSLVDNIFHVPLAYMPAWLLTDGLLSGKTATEVALEKQENYIKLLVVCAAMWIPFQYANFRYLPPSMQVLAVNAGCLVWNVILCFLTHEKNDNVVTSDSFEAVEKADFVIVEKLLRKSSDVEVEWSFKYPGLPEHLMDVGQTSNTEEIESEP